MNNDLAALIAWLYEQIAADEYRAVAAKEKVGWHGERGTGAWDGRGGCVDDGDEVVVYPEGLPTEEQSLHIAAHDPQHVLNRADADRQMVAACVRAIQDGKIEEGSTWNDDAAGAVVGEQVLRLMAYGMRDRDGYRAEWKQ